ncbi:MAG: 30S ribosomal protein S8 [Planctomycetota bacterium]|nr:30S ribosomal protein S8 [Planctomycetota bacterium]
MMTDPIADLLTQIRNALLIERPFVDLPSSKLKVSIADALQREGFIWDFEVLEHEPYKILRINLKYGPNGERVVQHISRVSKPGRRIYQSVDQFKPVLQGMGIKVLSTSRGVLSDREAKKQNVGGEVLCEVW